MINEIGQQRFDNFLEKLIKARPNSLSCPPGNGNPDVLTAAKGNIWLAQSVAQMLKKFHATPNVFNKNTVQSFDNSFASLINDIPDNATLEVAEEIALSCPNCKFDISMVGGVKYEFKSFKNTTIDQIITKTQFRR